MFHASWAYVAVAWTGLVGLWGIMLAIAKREPGRMFSWARSSAIAVMLVEVLAGVILWQQGLRSSDEFHVFYGLVVVFTFTFAYIYSSQLGRRPALGYGLLLLFVMGLGVRAWVYVG